jgi:hypothetical protein
LTWKKKITFITSVALLLFFLDLASLDPVNPVVKAGDVVMFQCTSPPNYTGEEYETIHFKFLHNGTEFTTTESTESIKGVHSVKKISIEIKGLEDSGNYTCVVTPSIPEMTVRVETHLYVIKGKINVAFMIIINIIKNIIKIEGGSIGF